MECTPLNLGTLDQTKEAVTGETAVLLHAPRARALLLTQQPCFAPMQMVKDALSGVLNLAGQILLQVPLLDRWQVCDH